MTFIETLIPMNWENREIYEFDENSENLDHLFMILLWISQLQEIIN